MNFRMDGVYIKKNDVLKDGYVTFRNGKYVRNSYGFWDKLYDIHRYGKTMDTDYSYIYFRKSSPNSSSEISLYKGTISGELTDILSNFISTTYFGTNFNQVNFEIITDDYITYKDSKGRNCSIRLKGDNNCITNKYVNFVTEEIDSKEYNFYPLNDF